MATDHTHEHGDTNPSVTYDKSDLSARGILMFFSVMIVFFVAMSLAALGLWVGLNKVAGQARSRSQSAGEGRGDAALRRC